MSFAKIISPIVSPCSKNRTSYDFDVSLINRLILNPTSDKFTCSETRTKSDQYIIL